MIAPSAAHADDCNALFTSIADGIATNGFSIIPAALPADLSQLLATHIATMPTSHFKRAGIGRGAEHSINDVVRTDTISWINRDDAAGKAWLDWTQSLQLFLNRTLFLGLFSFESHFAHYAKGDFYKKHKDAFVGEGNRILSVVVYLNQYWSKDDGGELVLYVNQQSTSAGKDDHVISVTPGFGTVVVFLSEQFPHEVLAARRDRFSIAGWFRLSDGVSSNIEPLIER
ncbi:2OG-Fe(II) oxygenase [Shewanella youngdeokensis]|uniref:2OG-Fe(II) oxygenase n=1 Tax=Shewanella youngdeokensis TaxID=2999068 RepID=A0ABZ0K217_9GAMM|nr:2OG-Fe(II) oxygenase [Shewanella sp. DAU334]